MFQSLMTLNDSKFNKNPFGGYFYFKTNINNFSEYANLEMIKQLRKGLEEYDTFIVVNGHLNDEFDVEENRTTKFNTFINSHKWSDYKGTVELHTNMQFEAKPISKSNIFVFKFETLEHLLDFQKYAIPSNISAYICTTLKEKKCCCK